MQTQSQPAALPASTHPTPTTEMEIPAYLQEPTTMEHVEKKITILSLHLEPSIMIGDASKPNPVLKTLAGLYDSAKMVTRGDKNEPDNAAHWNTLVDEAMKGVRGYATLTAKIGNTAGVPYVIAVASGLPLTMNGENRVATPVQRPWMS